MPSLVEAVDARKTLAVIKRKEEREGDTVDHETVDDYSNDHHHHHHHEHPPNTRVYKWRPHWFNIGLFTLWHTTGLFGLYYGLRHIELGWEAVSWLLAYLTIYQLSGFGVTAGAHRLWAHRTYECNSAFETLLMLLNCAAFQGDILFWARDHRVHHKCSETDADPHNATRGFFFSHCGWVLLRKEPEVADEGRKMNMSDLLSNKIIRFQRRFYLPLVALMCYGLPTLAGYWIRPDSTGALLGLLLLGATRHLHIMHATWCVNSVAHIWGWRPYNPRINPAENWLVFLLALGEGAHNAHHAFPRDYSTSEFKTFGGLPNFSTFFIDFFASIGWVWARHRSDALMKKARDAAASLAHPAGR